MKLILKLLIFIFSAVLLISCSTTIEVVSNKDAAFTRKINKVFITCKLDEQFSKLSESLPQFLVSELHNNGITAEYFKITPITLESEYKSALEKLGPDIVLTINKNEGYSNSGPLIFMEDTKLTLFVSALEPDDDNVIWRAKIIFQTNEPGPLNKQDGFKIAVEIVSKMKKDNLL